MTCAESLELPYQNFSPGRSSQKNERPEALEEQLLALKKGNEECAKTLLRVEWLITIPVLVIFLAGILASAFYTEFHPDFWPWAIAIMVASLLLILIVAFVALRIEQKAGFYVCPKCGHKFVPSYGKVFVAPHMGTARYMKCPHCHSKGWCKKTTEPYRASVSSWFWWLCVI